MRADALFPVLLEVFIIPNSYLSLNHSWEKGHSAHMLVIISVTQKPLRKNQKNLSIGCLELELNEFGNISDSENTYRNIDVDMVE